MAPERFPGWIESFGGPHGAAAVAAAGKRQRRVRAGGGAAPGADAPGPVPRGGGERTAR